MFLLSIPWVLVLLMSNKFHDPALFNCILQVALFIITAHIPSLLTKRMSYVDIAWPWGLFTIGLLPFISPATIVSEVLLNRANLVTMAFLVAGLRMGMGGLRLLYTGVLNTELPRYQYQRLSWSKQGFTEDSIWLPLVMQKEIFVQCLCNMGVLVTPLMIQAFGYKEGPLTWLEVVGWLLWAGSITFEHTADKQKKSFIALCKSQGVVNKLCNVGLWRYCRHPNYFGEWMVWNSLIITSIPSLLALWETAEETLIIKLGLSLGLVLISYMMYQCLVNYTGAKPAEFYSVQKRPEYKEYQSTVNMFFPGPRKSNKD